MTTSTRRTLAAALASSLTLAALFPVLAGAHWFSRVLGAVLIVAGTGVLARRVGVPGRWQPLLSLGSLAGYLVLAMVPSTFDNALPTAQTWQALRDLVQSGSADLERYAPPVEPSDGVVLIVAAGVGLVALVVDWVAVVLDRVALAGLPLLALFAVPSAVLPGGLGGLPFAFAATGWLVLLLEEGSDTVRQWGSPLRAASAGARPGGDDPGLNHVGRRIGVAALGVALLVPVLTPGLDHRLFVGSTPNGSGEGDGPNSATTYNPITRLREQLTLPTPRQLLVYRTDDPRPDYLRLTTLDTYTGNGWSSSTLEADRDKAQVRAGIPAPAGVSGAVTQPTETRLAIDGDNLDAHWLPLPYGPRAIDVDGPWLWDSASETAFSAARSTRRLAPYTVQAQRVLPDRSSLRAAGAVDPAVAQRYGRPLALSPDVISLARRITRGESNGYDRAVALQAWFTDPRNGFVYDLTPSQPRPGEDDLDGFLRGRRGYCQQYATAMAVLLRAVGLPSRVAVGFTPGRAVPNKQDTYRVTTSDAHAWPEAWFAGSGWVRFEPTPGASGATQPDYTLAAPLPPNENPTPSAAPEPSGTAAPDFRSPEDLLKDQPAPVATGGRTFSNTLLGWLLALSAVAVVLAPGLLGLVRRRRRGGSAVEAWAQLQDDVTDLGLTWDHAQSPRATCARLGPLLREPGLGALQRLATATELTRYAPAGRADRTDLRSDGLLVRAGLRHSVPRWTRWRAVLAPPSALRWAGHGLAERIADVLDSLDRLTNVLTAPVRRVVRLR